MSNVVNFAACAVKAIDQLFDVVGDVHQIAVNDNEDFTNVHCVSTLQKVGLLGVKLLQSIAKSCGASTSTLLTFKSAEEVMSYIGIPVDIIRKLITSNRSEGFPLLGFLEKTIGSVVMMVRLDNERCQLQEKQYLEMVAKDKNAVRPVYALDREGYYVKTGTKKIDVDECQKSIKALEKELPYLNAAEACFQINMVEKSYSVLALQLINLARHRPNFPLPPIIIIQEQNNNQREGQREETDALDLVRAHRIPQQLHDDPFFQEHVCAISHEPLRFPVEDPTTADSVNPTYYEYENIYRWVVVQNHRSSPMTRQALSESDLVIDTELQALIEKRLQHYQTHIDKYVDGLVKTQSSASSSTVSSSSSSSVTSTSAKTMFTSVSTTQSSASSSTVSSSSSSSVTSTQAQ